MESKFAESLGVSVRHLRRRGGLKKLGAMSPEACRVMLNLPHLRPGHVQVKPRGLSARGFGYSRGRELNIERRIQKLLRERGLVKDA